MDIKLSGLNPAQREAVETINGPLMILAGAGTGKTTVITFRIAWMIINGISPTSILGVSFTNKAAKEMLDRVCKLLYHEKFPPLNERPFLSTFHSWCVKILRIYGKKIGIRKNFVIYDELDQLEVLRRILRRYSSPQLLPQAHILLNWISAIKNSAMWILDQINPPTKNLLYEVYQQYEEILRAANALDFDDLLLETRRLFLQETEVLRECQNKFQYIMVDEFQDTNPAQFELIKLLSMKHRNLCVVGDDDQSIYSWRGAATTNFIEFQHVFPDVKIIKLEQNYRSTNNILKVANFLIKNNSQRYPKNLWSNLGDGPKVKLISYTNEDEEANSIAAQISSELKLNKRSLSDFAIIYRTNSQSRPIETALRHAGLKYKLIGGISFFERQEIKDFIAYLRVAIEPTDEISLLRIANVPPRGISTQTLRRLIALAETSGCTVYDVMKSPHLLVDFPQRTISAINALVEVIETYRSSIKTVKETNLGENLMKWADEWMERFGYYEFIRQLEKNPEDGENRVLNLKELICSMNRVYESTNPTEALLEFISEISLDREPDTKYRSADVITLITLHSAKGLEFERVFLVGVEEGLLPHSKSLQDGLLEEERRLFYVGITRARASLQISYCRNRHKYGELVPRHPSRFIKEIPSELLDFIDQTKGTHYNRCKKEINQINEWLRALKEKVSKKM